MADCGPVLATSRLLTASGLPPAAVPPAKGTGLSPSASPPLTAAPAGLPGFATGRLRTTFAPRIGKTKPARMPAEAAQAALHTPPFVSQRSPLLGPTWRASHTLMSQNS